MRTRGEERVLRRNSIESPVRTWEALSESVSLLRNRFNNYAFENETLLKVADARKIR